MRARVFRRETPDRFRFVGEVEADDADEVWRLAESGAWSTEALSEGDVVYIGDAYLQLDGDGGWRPLEPSSLTRELYKLATTENSGG